MISNQKLMELAERCEAEAKALGRFDHEFLTCKEPQATLLECAKLLRKAAEPNEPG
jgi:hypothetical protein